MDGEDGSTLALQALRAARSSKAKGHVPRGSRSGEPPPGPGRETRSRDWRRLLPAGSTAHPNHSCSLSPLPFCIFRRPHIATRDNMCSWRWCTGLRKMLLPDEPASWPQYVSLFSSLDIFYLKAFSRFVCLQSTNPPSFSTGFLVFAVRADLIFFSTGPAAGLHCSERHKSQVYITSV